jgi:hypothetical protein
MKTPTRDLVSARLTGGEPHNRANPAPDDASVFHG